MWFDGPSQILPIFHRLMWFDGPKKLMWFDGPKSRFSPFKISCVLMDPLPNQNLMCFGGPKTSCGLMDPWWFSGSIKPYEVFGSTKTHEFTKSSCDLMDPDFETSLGPSNHMRFLRLLWLTSRNEVILFWFKQYFCNFHQLSCQAPKIKREWCYTFIEYCRMYWNTLFYFWSVGNCAGGNLVWL